jgi:hypothetical protein
MTNFEKDTGLKKSEKSKFEAFARELSPYFDELNEIGVKVLIWGPGKCTKYYSKRTTIVEHLRNLNSHDEIATSEELLKEIEHPKLVDEVQLELLHAEVANLIIGLVTSNPLQSGIYMEINNILPSSRMVNKTWLIMPDRKDWSKVGAFIQIPILQAFPENRIKYFRMKDLDQCNEVRLFCEQKVGEERGRIMRKRISEMTILNE